MALKPSDHLLGSSGAKSLLAEGHKDEAFRLLKDLNPEVSGKAILGRMAEWPQPKKVKPQPPATPHSVLRRGLTHPQIHTDYYEWLKSHGEFEKNFRAKYSRSFEDFNAIAMWAWSRSREELRDKVKVSKAARDAYLKRKRGNR